MRVSGETKVACRAELRRSHVLQQRALYEVGLEGLPGARG